MNQHKRWWFLNCKSTVAPQQNSAFNILLPIALVVVAMFAMLAIGFAATTTHHANTHVQIAEIGAGSLTVIKNAISDQARAFEAFKDTNDKRLNAVKSGNEALAAELNQKLARIEPDLKRLSEIIDRVEELESRGVTPRQTSGMTDSLEHKGLRDYLRKGIVPTDTKDITVGSNAGGGYALPKVIAQQIENLEQKFSPVRKLVQVDRTNTTDYHHLLNLRGTTSGWVGETGSRSASNTPQLRDVVPTFGEIYAYPSISNWALQDLQFDPAAWLAENVAYEFAKQEGIAVISGNATNKPTGMVNTVPLSTADNASPLRTAAAYQYIDSIASPFSVNGSDALFTMTFTLNQAFRSNANWAMNSNTIASVRKLKDSQNRYLWEPSMAAGTPNTLLGYGVSCWEDLDDIASGKFPIVFGDFYRGYLLVDRSDVQVTRDEVTTPGYTKFYIRRREGGIVLSNDALKFIRTS